MKGIQLLKRLTVNLKALSLYHGIRVLLDSAKFN